MENGGIASSDCGTEPDSLANKSASADHPLTIPKAADDFLYRYSGLKGAKEALAAVEALSHENECLQARVDQLGYPCSPHCDGYLREMRLRRALTDPAFLWSIEDAIRSELGRTRGHFLMNGEADLAKAAVARITKLAEATDHD